MKAIVQDKYGSADVLELREIDRPGVKANEVLVRVHAAGVDPGVSHLLTCMPYPLRSVPLTSLTTRARTSPLAGAATTSSSTPRATAPCRTSAARSLHTERS